MSDFVLDGMKDFKEPIHQSTVKVALKCPRKFMYMYRLKLFPKGLQIRAAIDLGRLFHRLMELGEQGVDDVYREVEARQKEHMDLVDKGEDLFGEHLAMANHLGETLNKAIAMGRIFWEKYPPNPRLTTHCRECPVKTTVNLQGQDVDIEGTLDQIQVDDGGLIWIRDSKTSSMSLALMLVGYSFSIQCRLYRILATATFGEPIGFILDRMQSPTIKLCNTDKKNAKDWECGVMEAYIRRVKEWYEEKGDEVMRSDAIIYNEPMVTPELEGALLRVKELYDMELEPGLFQRDVTRQSCTGFNRRCPYYELCCTDPLGWESVIAEMYEVRPEPEDEPVKETEE